MGLILIFVATLVTKTMVLTTTTTTSKIFDSAGPKKKIEGTGSPPHLMFSTMTAAIITFLTSIDRFAS